MYLMKLNDQMQTQAMSVNTVDTSPATFGLVRLDTATRL